MLYSSLAIAALTGAAVAAPALKKRADIDVTILNYALTLEHLEDKFYREGLANYTQEQFIAAGFPDPFYQNLKEVSSDESTHVSFITSALQAAGAPATAECTYSFPATDPKSFVALASVLEGVGVSAYLGAAALIANPDYLTAAGSILTVEARHNAYIRAELAEAPFPQAFDTPLTFDEVYSLAAPFIVSCPSTNPTLPVKAFPKLVLGTTGPICTGQTITILTPGYVVLPSPGRTQIYAAFAAVTGPVFAPATPIQGGFTCVVPPGFNGQSYLVLTECNEAITDETTAAGPLIVEITGTQ